MAGVNTVDSYDSNEIRGMGSGDFVLIPCTIEAGQDLEAGTVIGERPTSGRYVAYGSGDAASATAAEADEGNGGDGACSQVDVQDGYTLTEDWVLTCTAAAENGGTFAVEGSVTGDAGNASVGVQFSHPAGGAYRVRFTVSDGNQDFQVGDKFTFSTVAAGARSALGILSQRVEAAGEDVISTMYVRGNFVESKLTGLDAGAKADLNGRSVAGYFLM
jgi:hypothetical protein